MGGFKKMRKQLSKRSAAFLTKKMGENYFTRRLAPIVLDTWHKTLVLSPVSSGQVHYRSAKGVARSMDALDWIAQLVSHIPDPGEQMVRYSGVYSNASRGKRRKRGVSVPVEGEVQDGPQPDSDAEHFAR